MVIYMKTLYTILWIVFFLIITCLLYNYLSIENMQVINIDKNNKEYMDMLISTTSIFGGIFVIVAILGLSSPITIAHPAISKYYSQRKL